MMSFWLIVVDDGGKSICSCGYSSQRYWTNDSSSNIFPAEIADVFCTESEATGAWAEDPTDELARRGDWGHARGKRPNVTEINHTKKKELPLVIFMTFRTAPIILLFKFRSHQYIAKRCFTFSIWFVRDSNFRPILFRTFR